jgi:hypothetical protein
MKTPKDLHPQPKLNLDEVLESSKEHFKPEEIAEMIDLAITKKKQAEHRQKYWEQLNEEPKFVKVRAEDMMIHFFRSYEDLTGDSFIMDNYTRPIIEALCLYFTNDARFERLNDGYSLKKGILLQGNVGCGKSSVMHVFQQNQKQSFIFVRCVDVAREYSKNGYKMFDMYVKPKPNMVKGSFFGQNQLGWCFDDLGFETEGKHFGKASNIMVEILDTIYADSSMRSMAHGTTNLTAIDIENHYGNRIKSRMRQMFNVIAYSPEAPDRRK